MTYQYYLLDALETVLAWELPEDDLAEAANDQAKLMAGCHVESLENHQENI